MASLKVLTEDLGKTAEYALCLLLETPFDGDFKYSVEKAHILRDRFALLRTKFTGYKHTGKHNNLYDFQLQKDDQIESLSVKTVKNKGQWKICPQRIGQTTKKRFCQAFTIGTVTSPAIKEFIQENLHTLLNEYMENTFHCPILFYNEKEDVCMMIELKAPIQWSNMIYTFSHKEQSKEWNESTTLKIVKNSVKITIGEFQVHNHRDGIKFRFDLKALLNIFKENFTVESF